MTCFETDPFSWMRLDTTKSQNLDSPNDLKDVCTCWENVVLVADIVTIAVSV